MAIKDFSVVQMQNAHRSIRRFSNHPVESEVLRSLDKVAERTATSCGLSLSSIIKVIDPEAKDRISKIAGQPYQAEAPHLWVFVIDGYRASRILEEVGEDPALAGTMDTFFQGYADCLLQAQSVVTAAESLGLGTCYLGSILNDPQATVELLKLPKYTFPAMGLMFGYPGQAPQLKPHLPAQHKTFENTYRVLDNYHESLREFDAQMQTYYDLRDTNRRVDSFTNQTVSRMLQDLTKRKQIMRVIQNQGFDLRLK